MFYIIVYLAFAFWLAGYTVEDSRKDNWTGEPDYFFHTMSCLAWPAVLIFKFGRWVYKVSGGGER